MPTKFSSHTHKMLSIQLTNLNSANTNHLAKFSSLKIGRHHSISRDGPDNSHHKKPNILEHTLLKISNFHCCELEQISNQLSPRTPTNDKKKWLMVSFHTKLTGYHITQCRLLGYCGSYMQLHVDSQPFSQEHGYSVGTGIASTQIGMFGKESSMYQKSNFWAKYLANA